MVGDYNGVKLTGPQSVWLRIAKNGGRDGLIEIARHPSLCALERRGFVISRPTRHSGGHRVAWSPTDLGDAWLAAEDRAWGR